MTNPNDGAPLTRRQLRELAAQAAGQTPAPAGEAPPQAPPAAPPAAAAPTPAVRPAVTPAARPGGTPASAPPSAPPAVRPAAPPMRARSVPTPVTPAEGFIPVSPASGSQAPLASRRTTVPGLVPDGPAGAPAQAPVPSRRSLREQTASHRVVIVPPSQSSAIRTVDETGQLSKILDLGAGRPDANARAESARPEPPRPGAMAPAAVQRPQRTPAKAAAQQAPQRVSAPGSAGQPGQPGQQQPGGARQGAPQSWSARPPTTVVGDRPQTFSSQGLGGSAPVAPAVRPVDPSQSAPLLREQAARDQAARDRAAREQASRTAGGLSGAWQPSAPAVEEAPGEFRQRITAPGFEPVPALQIPAAGQVAPELGGALPQWEAITTPAPAPTRSAAVDDEDDDDDFDDDEPDHKYTWLHYLILVAVAFVLGLIIWKVGLENRGVASPADSAASVGVVIDAPSTPHHYDL